MFRLFVSILIYYHQEEYTTDAASALSWVLETVITENKKETDRITYHYGIGAMAEESTVNGYRIYHNDKTGNTTAVTGKDGSVLYKFHYGTYGELAAVTDGAGTLLHSGNSGPAVLEAALQTGIAFLFNGQFGIRTDANGLYHMRARYYNTDIRRFINRDILTGEIGNSQSLNRYAYVQGNPVKLTDPFGLCPDYSNSASQSLGSSKQSWFSKIGHFALDALGFIPGVGDVCDLINAAWYFAEGDHASAAMSMIAALPFIGSTAATGMKAIGKTAKMARAANMVKIGSRVASSSIMAGVHLGNTIDTAKQMKLEKAQNGKISAGSWLKLGGGVLLTAIAGKSATASAKQMKQFTSGDTGKAFAKTGKKSKVDGNNKGKDSDIIVYRALNEKDCERLSQGMGLEAKNPNGEWSLKKHLVNGSGKESWVNDPFISTTSDFSVAEGFNKSGSNLGVVAIDMSKVSSQSFKGYEIFPRTKGVEGLPYYYSIWQQEISVYQSIPLEAIVGYFK